MALEELQFRVLSNDPYHAERPLRRVVLFAERDNFYQDVTGRITLLVGPEAVGWTAVEPGAVVKFSAVVEP